VKKCVVADVRLRAYLTSTLQSSELMSNSSEVY